MKEGGREEGGIRYYFIMALGMVESFSLVGGGEYCCGCDFFLLMMIAKG